MTRRVLLTGASGYAGGAVCAHLRASGLDVVTAGRHPDDQVFMDLLLPETLAGAAIPEDIEVCIHTAAVHEVLCREDPVHAYAANVTATRALVDAVAAAGIRRIVYVSTYHVYGYPVGRLDETVEPRPGNDYGLTHFFAEQILLMVARQKRIKVNVLRAANLCGMPVNWTTFKRWTLAPFDFVRQAVTAKKIFLHTDGSSVRHYVSLDRLGACVLAAIQDELPQLVHLSGRAWSMYDLAGLAADAVGQETGANVEVMLGNICPNESAHEFCSRYWGDELDESSEKMRGFLSRVAHHLLSENHERNITSGQDLSPC